MASEPICSISRIITDRAELEPVQAFPSTMKRIVLLLIPVIALAVGVTDPSAPTAREEMTGQLWQASIRAEADGDASAAMEKVTACAKHGGDAYMANLRSGWLCYSARKHDEASRCYDAAANLQPNALNPRLGLLNIAQAKNDGAAAILAAETVLKIEPTNYRALMAVAWGAFQGRDYRRSAMAYQRVLTLYPEDLDAISGAAWCAFYSGQKREARDGFRRLMSLNPDQAYARQGISATSK